MDDGAVVAYEDLESMSIIGPVPEDDAVSHLLTMEGVTTKAVSAASNKLAVTILLYDPEYGYPLDSLVSANSRLLLLIMVAMLWTQERHRQRPFVRC